MRRARLSSAQGCVPGRGSKLAGLLFECLRSSLRHILALLRWVVTHTDCWAADACNVHCGSGRKCAFFFSSEPFSWWHPVSCTTACLSKRLCGWLPVQALWQQRYSATSFAYMMVSAHERCRIQV